MTVWLEKEVREEFKSEDLIRKMIINTLKLEDFKDEVEVSITITDNERIREINRKFRNIDSATDVLSFPVCDFKTGDINRNEKGEIVLGDIIISLEKAYGQAIEYGHSIEREIAFLITHSMLHLLGYDHLEEDEEKIMFSKQEEILNLSGLKR